MFIRIYRVFQKNKYYKILLIISLIFFGLFSLGDPHSSYLQLLRNYGFRYTTELYLVNFIFLIFLPFSLGGLFLYNKKPEFYGIDNSIKEGYMEEFDTITYRKKILTFLFQIITNGFIWFILVGISVMGTDSCEDKCFPLQNFIGSIAFLIFPLVSLISVYLAINSYFLKNTEGVKKYTLLGSRIIWALSPLLFLGALIIF